MTHLGKMIRLYRLTQGVEQKAMADEIGITASKLGKLERGAGELDGTDLIKVMAWANGQTSITTTNGAAADHPQQQPLM